MNTASFRRLGYADEPKHAGAVVAVHYGDYRRQEIWVRSGANIGNWYCLGGEFGRPATIHDPRNSLELLDPCRRTWSQPEGTIPPHPTWDHVLARGPVVLLFPGADDVYRAGWAAGRHDLFGGIELLVYENPPNSDPGSDPEYDMHIVP